MFGFSADLASHLGQDIFLIENKYIKIFLGEWNIFSLYLGSNRSTQMRSPKKGISIHETVYRVLGYFFLCQEGKRILRVGYDFTKGIGQRTAWNIE